MSTKPDVAGCPICGRRPDIDECGPRKIGEPEIGWYANCYNTQPHEHNFGCNADTRALVIDAWNHKVFKLTKIGTIPPAPNRRSADGR